MMCPDCKSKSSAKIIWGYVHLTSELKEDIALGKYVLGGCLVTDHDPKWECNSCHYRWGERDD